MIRVLHVIGAMDRAGAETMIMNYYRHIDRTQIQFDFLVHTEEKCDYDDEIESLGGHIYRIPRFTGLNYFNYKKLCRELFEAHPEIDIAHGHIESSASIYLPEAQKAGKRTICHSHQSKGPLSPFELAFRLATFRNKHAAEFFMAPSEQAGIDRFGSRVTESDAFSVLVNAIDLKKFENTKSRRDSAKSALGIAGKPVFGHVGRFTKAKNHPFLIDVFQKIIEKLPDAQLVLVGKGEDEDSIRNLVERANLTESVHFLGVQKDVASVMAAMDVFLFPSMWEGLGIVAIEAQAAGLPCILSDAVPAETAISAKTVSLPTTNAQAWANQAIDMLSWERDIHESQIALAAHGYDIDTATDALTQKYVHITR